MTGLIDKLGAVYSAVMKIIVGTMSMVMLGIAGYAVFSRNILDSSVVWADTVATWIFTWTVFLGSAIAITKGGHMEIGIAKESLKPLPRKLVTILGYAAVIVACLFLANAGWNLLGVSGDTPSPAVGADLKWVLWSIPVGSVLMGFCALERMIRAIVTPAAILAAQQDQAKEDMIEEVV